MIAKVTPHIDQLRWYAKSALNGFDTLEHDDAVENAIQSRDISLGQRAHVPL
jgi:hypothetical protein